MQVITEKQISPLRRERKRQGLRLVDVTWLSKEIAGHDISITTLSLAERGLIDLAPVTKVAIARALRVDPRTIWEDSDG